MAPSYRRPPRFRAFSCAALAGGWSAGLISGGINRLPGLPRPLLLLLAPLPPLLLLLLLRRLPLPLLLPRPACRSAP